MTVLVDSDILIEVSRGKDATIVDSWRALASSGDIVMCSPVSVAELWHGAQPSEHETLKSLFQALVCDPIDASAGQLAGSFLRTYRKSHNMELGDALIAAAAVLRGAALWTRNRKHYPVRELAFYRG